jgi:hypothetical protein
MATLELFLFIHGPSSLINDTKYTYLPSAKARSHETVKWDCQRKTDGGKTPTQGLCSLSVTRNKTKIDFCLGPEKFDAAFFLEKGGWCAKMKQPTTDSVVDVEEIYIFVEMQFSVCKYNGQSWSRALTYRAPETPTLVHHFLNLIPSDWIKSIQCRVDQAQAVFSVLAQNE